MTDMLAKEFFSAERVKAGGGNEHIPTFSGQCIDTAVGKADHRVDFTFKFMVWKLFDLANLRSEQLGFNNHFASGGLPVVGTVREPP